MATIRLVPLSREHIPALLETMADPDTLAFTRTPHPMPQGWLEEWLAGFDGRRRVAFAVIDGMQRVSALISVDNPASSRVADKVGYTFEGVLRSLHVMDGRRGDMQSWSILPNDLTADGSRPA